MSGRPQDRPSTLASQVSSGSVATLGEENLSAYFEPFGAALAPASPGNRDSIASNESDTVQLLPGLKEEVRDIQLLCVCLFVVAADMDMDIFC